jgi:colicin import membrane protein
MATQTVTQPEQTTALAVIQSLTPARLFEAGVIDPILERIKAEVRAVQTDISTEAGRKAVASLAFKVARSKTFIDDQRKALVSDEKKRLARPSTKKGSAYLGHPRSTAEGSSPAADRVGADTEAARIAALEAAVNEIAEIPCGPYTLQHWQSLSVECMQDRIREIEDTNPGWQEFEQRAKYAKTEAIAAITALPSRSAQASDAEELEELARLRKEASRACEQKERDDQHR